MGERQLGAGDRRRPRRDRARRRDLGHRGVQARLRRRRAERSATSARSASIAWWSCRSPTPHPACGSSPASGNSRTACGGWASLPRRDHALAPHRRRADARAPPAVAGRVGDRRGHDRALRRRCRRRLARRRRPSRLRVRRDADGERDRVGDPACRACCSPPPSEPVWHWSARSCRRRCATRWPTRTCSASRPERRSARSGVRRSRRRGVRSHDRRVRRRDGGVRGRARAGRGPRGPDRARAHRPRRRRRGLAVRGGDRPADHRGRRSAGHARDPLLAPRLAGRRDLERPRDRRARARRRGCHHPRAGPAAERHGHRRRRRRSGRRRRVARPVAAARHRRAADGRAGRRQRRDRVRRPVAAARHPPRGGPRPPVPAAGGGAGRRVVPGLGRHLRAHGVRPAGDPGGRRDGPRSARRPSRSCWPAGWGGHEYRRARHRLVGRRTPDRERRRLPRRTRQPGGRDRAERIGQVVVPALPGRPPHGRRRRRPGAGRHPRRASAGARSRAGSRSSTRRRPATCR